MAQSSQVQDVGSGAVTYGHRFLTTSGRAGRAIKVKTFDDYRSRLLQNFVVLGRGERHGAPGGLRIEVADTGIGIAKDKIDSVFERFTQVETRAARGRGGTGLGLSLSRRLAELMGGSLTLESRLGIGTTVQLTLPLEAVAEPPSEATIIASAWFTADASRKRASSIGWDTSQYAGSHVAIGSRRVALSPSLSSTPGCTEMPGRKRSTMAGWPSRF